MSCFYYIKSQFRKKSAFSSTHLMLMNIHYLTGNLNYYLMIFFLQNHHVILSTRTKASRRRQNTTRCGRLVHKESCSLNSYTITRSQLLQTTPPGVDDSDPADDSCFCCCGVSFLDSSVGIKGLLLASAPPPPPLIAWNRGVGDLGEVALPPTAWLTEE